MAYVLVIGLNFFCISLLAGCRQTVSTPVTQSSNVGDHDCPTSDAISDAVSPGADTHQIWFNTSSLEYNIAADASVAGLNVFGISISIGSAGLGAPFLIIGALLSLIFQSNGEPMRAMTQVVWNERVQEQKLHLIGYRRTLQDIKDNTGDVRIANIRMLSLYDDLTNDACYFMRRDNVRSSAAYFREFATIRLFVNQALILGFPNATAHWTRKLDDNVRELVAYGNYVIQEDIKADTKSTLFEKLSPEMCKWLRQLSGSRRKQVIESNLIREGQRVSFKVIDERDKWLSCWVAGSDCVMRDCPGADNPMEQGPQYTPKWLHRFKCPGEVFAIYAIDRSGFIKSCSRVGIYYAFESNQNWWLSHDGLCPKTAACASFIDGECIQQVWRITAPGKPCGTILSDRDRVELTNVNNNKPVLFRAFRYCVAYGHYKCQQSDSQFVIFNIDVPHNSYVENLHCH